jgi:hypothetical protein
VKSVYQIAAGLDTLATWVAAVEVAGLVDLLKGDDYVTVFAPNDEAFSKMSRNRIDELLGDFENLAANIRYHIAPGRIRASELERIDSLRTVLRSESRPVCHGAGISKLWNWWLVVGDWWSNQFNDCQPPTTYHLPPTTALNGDLA